MLYHELHSGYKGGGAEFSLGAVALWSPLEPPLFQGHPYTKFKHFGIIHF